MAQAEQLIRERLVETSRQSGLTLAW